MANCRPNSPKSVDDGHQDSKDLVRNGERNFPGMRLVSKRAMQ